MTTDDGPSRDLPFDSRLLSPFGVALNVTVPSSTCRAALRLKEGRIVAQMHFSCQAP